MENPAHSEVVGIKRSSKEDQSLQKVNNYRGRGRQGSHAHFPKVYIKPEASFWEEEQWVGARREYKLMGTQWKKIEWEREVHNRGWRLKMNPPYLSLTTLINFACIVASCSQHIPESDVIYLWICRHPPQYQHLSFNIHSIITQHSFIHSLSHNFSIFFFFSFLLHVYQYLPF